MSESQITITTLRPDYFAQLAAHQRLCFPTLSEEELLKEEHFAEHYRLFPEGQHVALVADRVIGQSSTFCISGKVVFAPHTFLEIMGHGYFSTHDPQGEWLYGADMSIHPNYRGMRLSSRLYSVRKDLVKSLNLRGMVAGGMIPGYRFYRDRMSVAEYAQAVATGELIDPTLTPQLRAGFVVRGVLLNYLEDTELGNDATLIVWENPDFRP